MKADGIDILLGHWLFRGRLLMEPQLTTKDAYLAMYLFLQELYDRFGHDQLGGILGGMSLLDDGKTADPAIWDDWLRMVERVKSCPPDTRLFLQ